MLRDKTAWKVKVGGMLLLLLSKVVNSQTEESQVTLQFKETPVEVVLQALAEHQNLNLVMDEEVAGTLTLSLRDVPWQTALEIVLRKKHLSYERESNILLIFADDHLTEREENLAHKPSSPVKPDTRQSRRFSLRHQKAEEIAELLQTHLSEQGTLLVDERNRALIVSDSPSALTQLEQVLAMLDQPEPQIEISAHIVTISSEHLKELGVDWHRQGAASENSRDGGFSVSLPVTTPSIRGRFRIGRVSGRLLELELSALESENQVEIIASPRLLTANQQTATIKQGSEIPYEVSSGTSGRTSVEFKEAVLGMEVTPQLLGENKVELSLLLSQNMPGKALKRGDSEILTINKQEIKTQVQVMDGETLVLGGIFQHQRQQSVERVPILGHIPILGLLFQRDSEQQSRRELVVFITPTLVKQTLVTPPERSSEPFH